MAANAVVTKRSIRFDTGHPGQGNGNGNGAINGHSDRGNVNAAAVAAMLGMGSADDGFTSGNSARSANGKSENAMTHSIETTRHSVIVIIMG